MKHSTTVIAMTREMGTLGKEVARRVADRVGLEIVHHELVESFAERQAQPTASEVKRHLDGRSEATDGQNGTNGCGYRTPAEIFEIAARGGVIIRGWVATRLLRPIAHVLCVRICAPMEFRVAEMVRRLGVDEDAAHREIMRSDASHSNMFARLFEADWRKPDDYDLVLNTAHLGVETCAEMLLNALKNPIFQETEASRQEIQDRWLSARLKAALHDSESLSAHARYVHAGVKEGTVTLWGAVSNGSARGDIEKLVLGFPGVRSVTNEIHRVGAYSGT